MIIKNTELLLVFALFPTLPVHADTQTATVLAGSCTGCHGSDGAGNNNLPNIRALNKPAFRKAMLAYRTGTLSATVMNRIAKAYSEAEIDELANHFSRNQLP